jgi:hypothetical protein
MSSSRRNGTAGTVTDAQIAEQISVLNSPLKTLSVHFGGSHQTENDSYYAVICQRGKTDEIITVTGSTYLIPEGMCIE